MKKTTAVNLLRAIALIVLIAGATGSLVLMFNAGRNQKSILLIALFTGWVISPFIALMVANGMGKRWSFVTCMTIYFLMLFVTIWSLIIYGGVLNLSETKPAFKFLIVPLISWILIAVVIPVTELLSRKLSNNHSRDSIN